MKLEFDFDSLKKALEMKSQSIQKDVQEYVGESFTEEIMSDAAPIIENLLKSISSLPTRDGKYQFYDTDSDKAKAKANWRIPKNTGDPHLLLMWRTGYKVHKNGDCSVIVSNDKLVRGKSGDFYLFDLLWRGTKPYVVAAELGDKRKKQTIVGGLYKSGKKEGQKRPDKVITTYSEQDRFRKKYGKAAFKEWEIKMRELRAHQNKMLGTRNWHISAVEQDRRRRSNQRKGEAEAVDRAKAQRAKMLFEQAGGNENRGEDFGFDRSGGTKVEQMGLTQSFGYDDYKKMYKTLIHEKGGIIKGFAPKKMNYYNRFAGKFFFNQIYRKGIEGKVVQDFHEYVATCVYRGIMIATGNTDRGNKAMIVQSLSTSRGGNDIIYSH